MLRTLLPRPLAYLLLPALLSACGNETPPTAKPRTVLVQTAEYTANSGASFTGEVRARHEVDLAFRVGGKLTARLVDTGAEVKPGQPLARLDPADLEQAASAARAQLAAAESDFATARSERDRYNGLLAKKFVSQAAFDAKDNAFNSASARLEQARAQSRISNNQASYGTLSSDAAGVITAVQADTGQVVAAGQPVFRLARPDEKEIAIAVPEQRVAEVRANRHFTVNLWADPKTALRGELRELAPAADATTRTYAARIRLINPPPTVQLGMTARVRLETGSADEIRVPLSAVVDQGKGSMVWVVAEGKANPRPVSKLRFVEDGVLIGEGLQQGDQVIATGATQLVAGQSVQPQPLTPPERQR